MRAERHRPSGFANPSDFVETVNIVGFCYGEHRDAGGYDRKGSTVLAIFTDDNGSLGFAPVRQFRLPHPSPQEGSEE